MPQASDPILVALPVVLLDDGPVPEVLHDLVETADPARALEIQPDLDTALAAELPGPVVVILSSLKAMLETALRNGVPPADALAEQSAKLTAQLVKLRQHRRRVLLLERTALQRDPAACAGVLRDRLNVKILAPDVAAPHSPETDPALELLATLLVHNSASARRLADELEASAASPSAETDSPEELNRIYATLTAETLRTRALEGQATGVETLTQALEDRTAEIEVLQNNIRDLEEELKQAAADLDLSNSRAAETEKNAQVQWDQQARRERVLGAALLRFSAQAGAQVRKLDALTDQLGMTQAELENVYESKSWKVTAPLRSVRRGRR